MNRSNWALAGFACAIVIGAFTIGTNAVAQDSGEEHGRKEIIFHPPNPHMGGAPTAGATGAANPKIAFHGGPVMGTPHVYLIWYGNWDQTNNSDTPAGKALVKSFLNGLSGSPYYQINATYAGVTPTFTVTGETTDGYSLGSSLTDANIQQVVRTAITSGSLGSADNTGVYLVLTSSYVTAVSGFCTNYCGWHTHSTGVVAGSDIKYAFVGNANRCLNACAAQTISPNNNAGVDGMISVIAHELEEAHTDPNLNAWFDPKGAENADKCAWTFGSHQTRLPSGAYFNMTLQSPTGPLNFLVQRNLDVNSKCYIDYAQKWQ